MTKKHTSFAISTITDQQIVELIEKGYGMRPFEIVALAIDRMYREEVYKDDPKYLATELMDKYNRILRKMDSIA